MPAYTKIKCEICGQEISKSNMSKHLRRHELHPETFTTPKYRVEHDGLECQYCGKVCKNRNSLANHERLCKNNPNRQISAFIEYNKTISKGSKCAWNKGLTKETDERVAKYAASHKGARGKLSDNNPSRRPEVRKKISDSCLKRSQNGTWHTSLAKDRHIKYKGKDFDSTWEVAYAKHLDQNGIRWERTKDRFPYNYQDKNHFYNPDFYLPDTDEYIEIKGYSTGKDYAKWKQFPKDKILKVLKYNDLILLDLDIKN